MTSSSTYNWDDMFNDERAPFLDDDEDEEIDFTSDNSLLQ